MTAEQEREKIRHYKEMIGDRLRNGTQQDLRELMRVTGTDEYQFLMTRDKELLLFWRVITVWYAEHANKRAPEETVIGRTAGFLGVLPNEVTYRQLIEIYTIVKFAFYRLGSELPDEKKIEGVLRALLFYPSPELLIMTAKNEMPDEKQSLIRLLEVMGTLRSSDESGWTDAMYEVLEDYLDDLSRISS